LGVLNLAQLHPQIDCTRKGRIAAVALYVAHYNLCRVHETLRITPAMALDVTDHVWSIAELVNAATTEAPMAADS
jgi:hypothetical protein